MDSGAKMLALSLRLWTEEPMNITFLSISHVRHALAACLAQLGQTVLMAVRDVISDSLRPAQAKNASAESQTCS